MTNQKPASARETYEAYLRGEITPAEVVKRAQDWEAANRGTSPGQKRG